MANSSNTFPSDFIDPKKKESLGYGLQIAKSIWSSYNAQGGYMQSQLTKVQENRRYSEGTYDVEKFKNLLNAEEDMTALNIDWTPTPVISSFVDKLLGGFLPIENEVKLEAIDRTSKTDKDEQRKELEAKVVLQEFDQQIKEATNGTQGFIGPNEYVPKDQEEADIYFQLNFKQQSEIAMELGVDFVLESNDFDDVIKKKILRDLIENKKCAVKVEYDDNMAIRMHYVDIGNLVHAKSERDDFSDSKYFAEVRMIDIQTLRRMNPELPNQTLFDIAKNSAGMYGNRLWDYDEYYGSTSSDLPFDDYRIQVLDFWYKSIDVKNYEKNEDKYGNEHINERDYAYEPPKKSKYNKEKLTKELEVSYQGVWVVGTEYMVNYERSNNMVKFVNNGEYMPTIICPYLVYSPNNRVWDNRSLVDRMRPYADKAMLLELQMQNFIALSAPPGLAIDITAIKKIDLGGAHKDMSPLDLIKLYRQTGTIIYDGWDDENDMPMNRKPIDVLDGGVSQSIITFVELYKQQLLNISQLIGFNDMAESSKPDSRALVGVQKLALQQSNNATRELFEGYLHQKKKSAYNISRMIQDLNKFNGPMEGFVTALGLETTKILGLHDDKTLIQYGIAIEIQPSAEEREKLNMDVTKAIESGQIKISDRYAIERIKNVKQAEMYLTVRIKRNAEEAQKLKEQDYQAKAQADAQAAQMSAQVKQQEYQAKAQMEIAKEEAQMKSKLAQIQAQNKADLELEELKNLHKLEQIKLSIVLSNEMQDLTDATSRDPKEFKPTQAKPSAKKDVSLTKESPMPPVNPTPPDTGSAPSKIMES